MSPEDRYAKLTRAGLNFLPWVGDDYEQGYLGRKLLILGESHYHAWEGEEHRLLSDFTQRCVQLVIERVRGSPFWANLEQALLNEQRQAGWAPSGGGPLWHRLAFYNYLQQPLRDVRERPPASYFVEARSPFRAVLDTLRPERVLVCGRRLWERMEEINLADDVLCPEVQAYRCSDGLQIWCLSTDHPSSGRYSWRRVHPIFQAFMRSPPAAAELLGR